MVLGVIHYADHAGHKDHQSKEEVDVLQFFEEKKQQEIEIPADGISLDLLRAVYRNKQLPLPIRMRAAILPHEVPKLAVTAQITDNETDRRLARIVAAKANTTPVIDATPGYRS